MSVSTNTRVLCIGGGPAGLTAAYLLSKKGVPVTVLEADPTYLGGISRTVSHNGYRCDIGGHRFYTKSEEVDQLWMELLDEGFIRCMRKSSIYYRKCFFDYPLRAGNIFSKLGVFESALCTLSYVWARISPHRNPKNFEQWVCNNFGRRLFSMFFKTYTEKVWGMKCSEISADWAAQRIKRLTLWDAVKNAIFGTRTKGREVITTLINSFRYPPKGAGMMWESAGRKILAQGGKIEMGRRATSLQRLPDGGWRVGSLGEDGEEAFHEAEHVISSAPLREVVEFVDPPAPPQVVAAANRLRYRDFLAVGIIVKDRKIFTDQWIYIHDPEVKVGRIENFKYWSPEMVPDPDNAFYCMEYFCFEGDGMWSSSDAAMIELAKNELVQIGLAASEDVIDGFVIRQKKAYPIYDDGYGERVDVLRRFVESECPGLHLTGRNGMHRYNNQDHAMMTAMLAVENIVLGEQRYNLWNVNQEAEYYEKGEGAGAGTGRLVPRKVGTEAG